MKRLIVMATLCAATIGALAAPAFAHNEIDPQVAVTGKPTYFTLKVANEGQSDLVEVSIEAPAGTPFGELTNSPTGWAADASEDKVTWSGGSVAPSTFGEFGYEIESADQPGTLNYKVTTTFEDGSSEDSTVAVTAKAPASATKTPPAKASNKRATVALGVGIIALLLGIGALVVALNKGKAAPAAAGATSDGGTEAKNW